MNKKRILVYATVLAVLAVLVYFQFRNWKNFDWAMFWSERPDPVRILYAAGFIYFSYFLRALRWKIFLRPVRKEASLKGILPATVIGFTGLALLGRPGELIRPYLDRPPRGTDVLFTNGGLGGGADFRCRRIYRAAGAGDFSAGHGFALRF